jgi:hypothetical protein
MQVDGDSTLYQVCSRGDLPIVKALLAGRDVDVNLAKAVRTRMGLVWGMCMVLSV